MISMQSGAGALDTAYSKYSNSIQKHIDSFKAAIQSLSQTAIDSGFINNVVDAGMSLVHILEKIVSLLNSVGGIAPIITAVFGGLTVKTAPKILSSFSGLIDGFKSLGVVLASGANPFTTIALGSSAATAGIGLVIAALTAVVAIIARVKQEGEAARQAALQAGTDFTNSVASRQASTEQYTTRISELKQKIDEGKLSQEELYNVQAELLSIQDELSSTYGKEADSINLLTMSADEAADAIENLNSRLTKRESQEYITKYGKEIEKATKKIEQAKEYVDTTIGTMDYFGNIMGGKNAAEIYKQLQDIVAKYDFAELVTEFNGAGSDIKLKINADAKNAQSTIYGLSHDIQDLRNNLAQEGIPLDNSFNFSGLTAGLKTVEKILDDWESIYNSAIKAEIAGNDAYSKIVRQYQDAEKAYNDAVNGSFDTTEERYEAISKALKQMDAARALFQNTTFDKAGIQEFIGNLFDAFEEASKNEELKLNFKLDLQTGEKKAELLSGVYDALKAFADDAGELSKISIDLAAQEVEAAHGVTEGLSDEALAYLELDEIASQYGMTVNDLIGVLTDLGYLHFETADGINDEISSLTTLQDELEGATRRLNEYKAALEGGEKGDIASQYASAFKSFIDDWDAGKTGSNRVQAAIELFIPEDILRSLDYDIQQAGELLSSDMYRAIFNTDGDPGANFANYIRDTYGNALAGIVDITENGDSFDVTIGSYQALADALGMDVEVVHALCDALDIYGVQMMMSAEDTQALADKLGILDASMSNLDKIKAAIDGLANDGKSATQIKQIVDQLASAGYIDTSGIEGLGNMIGEAVQKVAEVDEQDASPTITLDDEQFREDITQDIVYFDSLDGREGSSHMTQTTDHIDNYYTNNAGSGSQSSSANSGSLLRRLFGGGGRAGGTKNSPGGETLVNELGPELISENGEAYIAGGGKPTVVDLSPGAIVLDAETTKKALRGNTKQTNKMGAMSVGSVLSSAWNKIKSVGSVIKTAVQNIPKITTTTTTTVKTGGTVSAGTRTPGGTTSTSSATTSSGSSILGAVKSAVVGAVTGAASKLGSGVTTKGGSNATVPISSGGGSSGGSGYSGGGGSSSSPSSSSSAEKEETWFEKLYAEHNHLLKMDKESQQDYLDWLEGAYKQAYAEGIIDLKDYRKYEEEVYKGRQDDFKDHLKDTEHLIDMEKNGNNNPTVILNMYQQMLNDIQNELNNAYANGLDASNDYVQYLQNQWYKYYDDMKGARDDAASDTEKQVKDLVDYRIKMLKQYIKNEINSLKDRLSYLKDFYSKQKEMLQDVYDTENYLAEQSEKRKGVSDIQNELQQLEFDDSAWAQKRKLQLKQELDDAQKELNDFERQHALSVAQEQLDAAYDIQEAAINARIDQLNDKLEDPQYLYKTALRDVQNNSIALYEEMIDFNNKYGLNLQAHAQGDLCNK